MCVSVCVRSNLPPHTLESQKRDIPTDFITVQEKIFNVNNFAKNALFKS